MLRKESECEHKGEYKGYEKERWEYECKYGHVRRMKENKYKYVNMSINMWILEGEWVCVNEKDENGYMKEYIKEKGYVNINININM